MFQWMLQGVYLLLLVHSHLGLFSVRYTLCCLLYFNYNLAYLFDLLFLVVFIEYIYVMLPLILQGVYLLLFCSFLLGTVFCESHPVLFVASLYFMIIC